MDLGFMIFQKKMKFYVEESWIKDLESFSKNLDPGSRIQDLKSFAQKFRSRI